MRPREEQVSNIFRATIGLHGRDVMDWLKDSGSDLQAGRPQAEARQHKGVWEYEAMLSENAIQQKAGWRQIQLSFVSLDTSAI